MSRRSPGKGAGGEEQAVTAGRLRRVCVYCGSNPGRHEAYREAACALGRTLAGRALGVVYGGASVGLMGAVAEAALDAGGEVIGVIPRGLVEREIAHAGLARLHVVESMHDRKALMTSLSDAFVALPGGLGTLDELFEALTWAQLGLHSKPVGLLNVEGFFDPLLTYLDHAVAEGFLRPAHRGLLLAAADVEELLERLAEARPVRASKWTE